MHLRERAFSFQATDAIPEYDVRPGDWVHVDDSFADSPVRIVRRLSAADAARFMMLVAHPQRPVRQMADPQSMRDLSPRLRRVP